MISKTLALRLKAAGLAWEPAAHDRFVIPDRDLDDEVFSINDLSTEVRDVAGRPVILFNGAVEWSLDWIVSREVVWLPTEDQLRDALGDRFVRLQRLPQGYRCVALVGGTEQGFDAAAAADAYGEALLGVLAGEAVDVA